MTIYIVTHVHTDNYWCDLGSDAPYITTSSDLLLMSEESGEISVIFESDDGIKFFYDNINTNILFIAVPVIEDFEALSMKERKELVEHPMLEGRMWGEANTVRETILNTEEVQFLLYECTVINFKAMEADLSGFSFQVIDFDDKMVHSFEFLELV